MLKAENAGRLFPPASLADIGYGHRWWPLPIRPPMAPSLGPRARPCPNLLPQGTRILESHIRSFLSPPLLPDAGPGWQRCWGRGSLDWGRPGSCLSPLGVFSTLPFTAVVGETPWGAAVLLPVGGVSAGSVVGRQSRSQQLGPWDLRTERGSRGCRAGFLGVQPVQPQGPCTYKGPTLSLMLCCSCLKILHFEQGTCKWWNLSRALTEDLTIDLD